MNIVALDFECFFDPKARCETCQGRGPDDCPTCAGKGTDPYTLKGQRSKTTEAYVRDRRYETLLCGVRLPDGEQHWLDASDCRAFFTDYPLDKCAVLCHHAHFDGLILSHHYGVRPYAWLDTLSMARLLVGNHLSVGLDSLARHFGLQGKNVPYDLFKGKHWAELDEGVRHQLSAGCLHDIELTWRLFNILAKDFPREEYAIVDATVRMFTEPVFEGDVELLGEVWTSEAKRKRELLEQLGVTAEDLQSADSFVALLACEGVEVPTKQGKNGPIPCVAKTDEFMKEIVDEASTYSDRIRTLTEARLGVRSTIDQTRAERLGFMAGRGAMPVYLSYCGAHTTRWSGGDKVNWQNFKRGGGLRRSVRAPASQVIIKADKSQVECRFLNYLAGQMDVVERFRNHEDPYVKIASEAYGHEVYKPAKDDPRKHEMEVKRGTGKQLELSCGYGAGAATIVATAARGTYGPPVRIDLDTGTRWRDLYRNTHPAVVRFWTNAESCLTGLAAGQSFSWSIFHFRDGKVWLPNGCPLIYEGLHWGNPFSTADEPQQPAWFYKSRKGWKKIWGGYFVENLIQAVSRVDMSQTLLRLRAKGYRAALLEHDAAAFVVPCSNVDKAMEDVQTEFRRAPQWLIDVPLDCECTSSERYS